MGLKETPRSERLEREREELSRLSLMDPLTSLSNRRGVGARITSEFDGRRGTGRDSTRLMVGIDHFELFNDHHGHVDGDRCLRAVAKVLERLVLREGNALARIGGKESAVLLADDGTRGPATGERLRRLLAEAPIPHAGRRGGGRRVTVSVGIATSEGLATPGDLLTATDLRLYDAKRSGRDLVRPDDRGAATRRGLGGSRLIP